MAYADYEFYQDVYLGALIARDDFPRLAERASDYIYAYTQGISDRVSGRDLDMVKKATCAVAEVLQDEWNMTASAYASGGKLASESVGSWSQSYSTAALSDTEIEYLVKRKLDAMMLYLGNLSAFSGLFRVKSYKCVHRARRCL